MLLALGKALEAHGMTEVSHPAMTKISGHNPPQIPKLDRWYIPHDYDQLDLLEPSIWIVPHSHEPGTDTNPPSDHFPVHLSATARQQAGSGHRIPNWLAGSNSFSEMVSERWTALDLQKARWSSPYAELEAFDRVMTECSRTLTKAGNLKTESKVEAIALGVAIHRDILQGTTDFLSARARCKKNTILDKRTNSCTDLSSLSGAISKLVVPELRLPQSSPMRLTRSTFSQATCSFTPPAPSTKRDFNREVKAAIGKSNDKLTYIVDAGDRIENPDKMAASLKRVWQDVWKGSPASRQGVARYLRSYKKVLPSEPGPVTLARMSSRSSPGLEVPALAQTVSPSSATQCFVTSLPPSFSVSYTT